MDTAELRAEYSTLKNQIDIFLEVLSRHKGEIAGKVEVSLDNALADVVDMVASDTGLDLSADPPTYDIHFLDKVIGGIDNLQSAIIMVDGGPKHIPKVFHLNPDAGRKDMNEFLAHLTAVSELNEDPEHDMITSASRLDTKDGRNYRRLHRKWI